MAEVEAEMKSAADDTADLEAEFGDLLFAVINAARLYGVDPENALEHTNRKFIARFNHLEKRLKENNLSFSDVSLPEMDRYWDEAKNLGINY